MVRGREFEGGGEVEEDKIDEGEVVGKKLLSIIIISDALFYILPTKLRHVQCSLP